MKTVKTFKILFIATLLLIPSLTFAKSQVKASQIIDQINAGKAVQYKDAEIVGDLDFTSIKDVTLDAKSKKNRLWSKGSTLTYWCHVRSPISFINCVFKGDVLAYIHDEDENETYNAIFYKDVDFQGCDFQGKSAFKYVEFRSDANFKNTQYHKEALFKYTKFSTDVSFSGSSFHGEANFTRSSLNPSNLIKPRSSGSQILNTPNSLKGSLLKTLISREMSISNTRSFTNP
jgi:uncharacterized protein YjbI with pentapeptide repeats